MSKLLELFNKRDQQGQIYRKTPGGKRSLPVRDSELGQPFHYVYPDGEVINGGFNTDLKDQVKHDEVFAEESVSVIRDRSRLAKFEKTQIGARFLQKQIDLQRTNTFIHARDYRKDNITDHVDPLTHKPRHGSTISIESAKNLVNIPGEFAHIPLNIGRLQGETADNLTSSFGPVYYRMNSREGMLNSELTLLKMGAATVRRRGADFINDTLSDVIRPIQQARVRLTGAATVEDRPEIEYKYLEQIWKANSAGQHYLGLSSKDDSGTYKDFIGDKLGFRGYTSLKISGDAVSTRALSNWLDELPSWGGNKVVELEGGRIGNFLRGRGMSDNTIKNIKGFAGKFLPKAHDIHILRTLKRFTVDIDNIINRVNTELGSALGMPTPPGNTPTKVNLLKLYTDGNNSKRTDDALGAAKLTELTKTLGLESKYLRKYMDQIKKHKNKLSIGFLPGGTLNFEDKDKFAGPQGPWEGADGTRGDSQLSDEPVPESKRYYKDYMQIHGSSKSNIFRNKTVLDSDSIDVIMQVMGTKNEEVRFRAFIEDIKESVQPSYNENNYIGRYETFYTYEKVIRNTSFQLRLHAFSKEEREHIMQKMAYLTSLAYPEASDNYLTPLVTNLTIGKVYTKQPCLVQGLTHTIESDVSWDIDEQSPMSILCAIDVRLLDKEVYTNQNMKGATDPFGLYLLDTDARDRNPELFDAQAAVGERVAAERQRVLDLRRANPIIMSPVESLINRNR